MAAGARVLILDQPTAGVDIGAKEELYAQVDRLAREGVAIIFISDDLDEILRMCDRVVVMRRGRAEAPVSGRGHRPREPARSHQRHGRLGGGCLAATWADRCGRLPRLRRVRALRFRGGDTGMPPPTQSLKDPG